MWLCNVCKNHDDALAELPQVGALTEEFQPHGAFLMSFATKVGSVFRRALLYGHAELVTEITELIMTNRYCSTSASLRHCFAALTSHQRKFGLSASIAANSAARQT